MNDELPEVSVSPARKVFLSGASVVWIIPLLALAVALYISWTTFNDRGPLISVQFEKGAGIKSGETELKYRDVTVGVVEKVGFTEDLTRVVAQIRVDKEVAPFIDRGALFWIVQPEVSAQGITGLSTVLSGVYIEGSWDDQIGPFATEFSGASQSPLIRPGQGGLEIAFRTVANGQLTDNAPILFKGIEVGRIGRARIAPRGNFAVVEALIFEEHRGLINSSTRFWDTSGFSVSIGPSGAEIDFSSLATLVGGGVTFDTFVSGGRRVPDGTVFEIFPTRDAARNSVFNASEVEQLDLSIVFDDNIAGLTVGAPVELSGLKIGQVESLSGVVNTDQFGDSRVRLNANISIQPARLGLQGEVTPEAAFSFLQENVAAGLRARLASASLLTGGLKVEMVLVENATNETLTAVAEGLPIFPTTQSETSDAAATVEGVFTRINNLPIEELLNSAINFLNSADAFVSDEDLRETPADVRLFLNELQGLVASEDVQNIPVSLNATLMRIEGLVAQLEEQRLATRLSEVLESAASAATAVETSVAGLPELLAQIEAVAAKAENLAVEELLAELTDLTQSAGALLQADDVVALPGDLRLALANVDTLLTELRGYLGSEMVQGIPAALNQTLGRVDGVISDLETQRVVARLGEALDGVAEAADTVEGSVAGVPDLIAQFEAVAAKIDGLAVDELLSELSALTRSADAVIGTDDAVALPGALKRALDEVNYTLQELRNGGAIENVNRTLASARNAADSIAITSQDLPRIVERLTALFAQAGRTIEGYNKGDQLSRTAETTLRDIQKAADALASLAKTIERNPNSLLIGR